MSNRSCDHGLLSAGCEECDEIRKAKNLQRTELEALRAENAELKAKFSETKTTCAYCLATREAPCSPEDVQAHIEECPRHPLKFARVEVGRLRSRLEAAHARVEQLKGALLFTLATHDQGHSPCSCADTRYTLGIAEPGGGE